MDVALAAVTGSLAYEFGDLRSREVADVVSDCFDEYVFGDVRFVEDAARARLSLVRRSQQPQRASATPGTDALDVSLHDGELADEVELTVRLIVAANESDRPLAQQEVDAILEVSPST